MVIAIVCISCLLMVLAATAVQGPRAEAEERVLLVGSGVSTGALVDEIAARPECRWRLIGVVANLASGPQPAGPWLGPLSALSSLIRATQPTRIITAGIDWQRSEVGQALLDARLWGIRVESTSEAIEALTGKLPIEKLTARALLASRGFQQADTMPIGTAQVATRIINGIAAVVGLVLLLPVLVLIAIAIRLDSPGPVFFSQARIGMGNRPFRLLKFRTMRESHGPRTEWVSDNVDRITRVGRWLRRFRLDELPQLVNVLKGDMNLVGPRPHPVSNADLFLARIPHYRLRFTVRPGITGWAQVRYGYANGLAEETEKMRYDLYYIKHRSLVLDLQILLETARLLVFDNRSHEQARATPRPQSWMAAPVREQMLRASR